VVVVARFRHVVSSVPSQNTKNLAYGVFKSDALNALRSLLWSTAMSYTCSPLAVVVVGARTLRAYAVAVVAGQRCGHSDARPCGALRPMRPRRARYAGHRVFRPAKPPFHPSEILFLVSPGFWFCLQRPSIILLVFPDCWTTNSFLKLHR